jgi:hypothetical protein
MECLKTEVNVMSYQKLYRSYQFNFGIHCDTFEGGATQVTKTLQYK